VAKLREIKGAARGIERKGGVLWLREISGLIAPNLLSFYS
jgi:hypothetical protein